MRQTRLASFLAVVVALAALTTAAPAHAAAPTFPALSGRVVDEAQILSPQVEADLTAKLAALEAQTTRQLVVATVSSLQGYPIEDFGYQLGRTWGIGQKGQNNGVILLVAPADRQVRIEVGYGLEPVLTDALSSVILQQAVLPKFRSGDMAGGVVAGTDALIAQLRLPDEEAKAKVAEAAAVSDDEGGSPLVAFITFIIIILVISRMVGGGRRAGLAGALLPIIFSGGGGGRGGGWGGGGGGGGGFGGGGGSFGGGGSSGSW